MFLHWFTTLLVVFAQFLEFLLLYIRQINLEMNGVRCQVGVRFLWMWRNLATLELGRAEQPSWENSLLSGLGREGVRVLVWSTWLTTTFELYVYFFKFTLKFSSVCQEYSWIVRHLCWRSSCWRCRCLGMSEAWRRVCLFPVTERWLQRFPSSLKLSFGWVVKSGQVLVEEWKTMLFVVVVFF